MKKKGFTLIELLAVIVILAIIALIATPIVMNVIENARKGAAERSAENYIDAVETAIMEARLDGPLLADDTYSLIELEAELGTIEVSGNKPTEGSIKISNGSVVTDSETTLKVGDYTVSYDANGKIEAIKYDEDSRLCTYVAEEGTTEETVGAKYICHLDTDRTFYVLENSEESMSLIMDRNFTDGVVPETLAWCIDGGSNNKTCQNINSTESNPLKRIQDIFGDKVEVSFPTAEQIANASEKTFNEAVVSGLDSWLYDNPSQAADGYWTASPAIEYSDSVWQVIFGDGEINCDVLDYDGYMGVRPVITIPKV